MALGALAAMAGAWAQDEQIIPDITTQEVVPGIYMLIGMGGNMGLSVGDATFLIDDQYAPINQKIKAAVAALTDQPVKFVLNTHHHADHTGGNEAFGKTGAVIVAHDNVRTRMSAAQVVSFFNMEVPAAPAIALPVLTFDNTTTFHLNGHTISAFHVPKAHTDGDVIVHFKEANVMHMGDTYFSSSYPFFDLDSGGSVDGMIAAADRALSLANDDTRIMPGHGPLATPADLRDYRDMLVKVRQRVANLIADGADEAAVIAARPTRDLDRQWSAGTLTAERWLPLVYASLNKD
jgi:glyoxylase-like metal-dependent hydrolase (beta-lactamase superfamily II)